jgi:acyl-CoA hydrolase
MASVNYVGKTSLVVGIRVISENIKTNKIYHTNTSYFTMVAKDEQNKPIQVPGLILESREQVRRFFEARRRKQLKQNYNQEAQEIKVPESEEMCRQMLADERCIISG